MTDDEILSLEGRRDELLSQALASSLSYLRGLDRRPVGADEHSKRTLREALAPAWPANGLDDQAILQLLDQTAGPATVASAGRRYFGFVTGGALPVSLAANWLAGAWDQNAFSLASSPAAVLIEECAARWTLDALRLPADWGVGFVTGATLANFAGLAAARHALLARVGWDVESDGLYGAPPLRVVVGAEAHPAMFKALGFLGLGRNRVERVPVDSEGRLRVDALPVIDDTCIVCAQAGNVNSGAFDPLRQLGESVRAAGAWLHVDGAFGIWARASEELAHLADGAELAHSIATDAHKWLNVPYDSGIVVVQSPQALHGAMSIGAAYLPMAEVREPLHFSPESSRRARGVEVWAALASLGRAGLARMIERNCELARRMARQLDDAGIEVLNGVQLNQVVVAFGDEARTARVIAAIQRDGTCWCGPTRWRERAAMRISVSSWATTAADIDGSAEAIVRAARAND